MIVYGFMRRFLPERYAVAAAAVAYALLVFLFMYSLSQIAADLRYANV
jgi:hypothetical protein